MKLDDEIVEAKEWDAVRVPPGTWRGYEAGPEGLEIIVIGAPATSARLRAKTSRAGATGGLTSAGRGLASTAQPRRRDLESEDGGDGLVNRSHLRSAEAAGGVAKTFGAHRGRLLDEHAGRRSVKFDDRAKCPRGRGLRRWCDQHRTQRQQLVRLYHDGEARPALLAPTRAPRDAQAEYLAADHSGLRPGCGQ